MASDCQKSNGLESWQGARVLAEEAEPTSGQSAS